MEIIHTDQVASITELKKNPSRLIQDANGKPVAILNHNTPEAYLIPRETYEKMLDLIDDKQLETLIHQRLSDGTKSKAKIFQNGQSQAVRLPKEFRFSGQEVFIKRIGNATILTPVENPWDDWAENLNNFSDDFMSDRNQPSHQERDPL